MKRIIPILLFIFFGKYLQAQNVNFDWVAHFGEIYWEKGRSITVDASGNIYSAGYFSGTIDFDPGPGVFSLSAINNTYGFITKFDANRNFIWAKKIDGQDVHPLSMKIDVSGSLVIFGSYGVQIDLDPGPAVVNGSSTDNLFLIKLDASGNYVLGRTFANTNVFNKPFNLALDPSGNAYITGTYGPFTDLDPGPGIFTLPNVGADDVFILKLDINGDFVWAKGIGSQSTFDEGNAIAVDNNNNVYITGVFTFSCDFDPGPGVFNISTSTWSSFVLKLNSNGDFVLAKHFEPIPGSLSSGTAIAVDPAGNIFAGGLLNGVVDFDPGPATYSMGTNSAAQDGYICKLDVSGNFLWAKQIGNTGPDFLNAITLDAGGNVFTTGSFNLTVDFDPGAGIYNLTSSGWADAFISKLDPQGEFLWAKAVGGANEDYGTAIVVDAGGSVYTIGAFESTADLDPGPAVVNLISLGFDDIFLLKLGYCTNNTFSVINASACNNYVLNSQTYNTSGTYTQVIPNSAGCDSIITLNLTINRKFTSINVSICEGQTYYAGGANQTATGVYHDTLLTTLGCDSVITTTLTVHPAPKPNLGADGNICSNSTPSITPGIFNSYLWHDNSTQSHFTVTAPGQYWVTVAGANNCLATDTVNILDLDTLPVNFLPADQQLCYGNELKIAVPGYANYLWSTGSTSNTASLNKFGTHYLTVTDYNNCTGIDSIRIQRKNCIYTAIPNTFTPNKDGKNDIFKPTINQAVLQFSFIIFNRYGEKIFETYEYGKGWDGTYKGKEQQSGTYVYRITFTNVSGFVSENNGTVLLIR